MLGRIETLAAHQRRVFLLLGLAAWLPLALHAQSIPPERPRARPPSELTGWADWEKGEEIFRRVKVPPAPPLSPEEAMKTFKLAPGYRLELVAAEPMVQNPIFFEFDPDGRIWVVEYQGYMRDLKGTGEGDSICRVVVLKDTDEDGRADKSTVFLDKLVMPRCLSFVKGGVLVAEPPKLWFCEDTNGDLRCDVKTQVGEYSRAGNPQHAANGLRYGLDNWLHCSDCPKRHRFIDGKLIDEPTVHRGQFGVMFDDVGRYMTCYESSALHADLIPAEYLLRNPNFLKAYQRGGGDRSAFGVNVNIGREAQEVFPIRPTPQITLGALELRDDGRLRTYTVVAGVCFYNGDQFPADAYGNVFIPEAGGHLIGRLKLTGDLELKASRFYPAEQELLASTDERFRPVGARVGPDGALYVADMYHGIIEHVIFLAPWLEKQVKERDLETGNDMGRIYRIVHEGKPINRKRPRLASATSAQLADTLNHANGWWRLTAQRLLVERRDKAAIPVLKTVAAHGSPLGRLHALWTLEGMEKLDWQTALVAVNDKDERVRATAVRLAEGLLTSVRNGLPRAESRRRVLFRKLEKLASEPSQLVRLQTLLTLGAFNTDRAEALMAEMVTADEQPLFRAAAMTGLQGRELDFLVRLLFRPEWQTASDHRRPMMGLLAQAVIDEKEPEQISSLLEMLGTVLPGSTWRRDAILDGILAAVPPDLQNVRPLRLTREPAVLTRLAHSDDSTLRERAFRVLSFFTWPGAPSLRPSVVDVQPLTPEEQRRAEAGEQQFALLCAACHQPHGGGLANVAPPLSGSEWIHGPTERLARIVLHGLYGPVEVKGERWNLAMPGFGAALDDEQIAAILTYVGRAWGNTARPVEPSLIARVRQQTESRSLSWTADELEESTAPVPAGDDKHPHIHPDAKGELVLPAHLATTYGRELAYRPSLDILAPWRRDQDIAEWRVEAPSASSYEVFVTLAADDASAGDKVLIETEGSKTSGLVESSGGYDRFREYRCGQLTLRPGLNRIVMRPDGPLKRELADVRELRLVPARQP
ncbi:MAG: c-type cytochrome [Verrucomicrobia bacterium]|nr:c-type cytochrome [Verrucomicrobiota bacterium]